MAKKTVKFMIKDLKPALDKIVKGWQRVGEDIFALSQDYCPVDEGTLQMSGAKNSHKTDTGYIIVYRTSYAARQEFGVEPGTIESVKRHWVKKHKRKTLVHKKFVRAHYRGPFIRQFPAGIDGKFFLTRAFDEHKDRLNKILVRHIGKL